MSSSTRKEQTQAVSATDDSDPGTDQKNGLALGVPIPIESIPEPRMSHLQVWQELCSRIPEGEAWRVKADDVTARHNIRKLIRRGLISDNFIVTTRRDGKLVYVARLPSDPAERRRIARDLGYGRWTRSFGKKRETLER